MLRSFVVINIFITLFVSVVSCGGSDHNGENGKKEMPFKVEGDYFYILQNEKWETFYIEGINLGVGVPGTQPGELAISEYQYVKWFKMIADAGFNSIRIYTLHYPRFYRLFKQYNEKYPQKPLYLFHGIWLEEINSTGDLYTLTEDFEGNIYDAVNAVHGNAEIPHRFGKAYGTYEHDISDYVAGWIIGREVIPYEVIETNYQHEDDISYRGSYVSITDASPTEVWITRQIEKLISYEKENFGVERPVSFSSWPTLDPLKHPTESSLSTEDIAQIDLKNVVSEDFNAGYFASFHAYPYYPDFISEQPGYKKAEDDYGKNSYLGYLNALKNYYDNIPLLIAEFGVPSSLGNAHYGHSDMNHGGHTETQQGNNSVRMFNNIKESRCAGGMLFAWMDEWWKPTWITNPRDFPRSSRPYWSNVTAPEQNFGLLKWKSEEPLFTDLEHDSNEIVETFQFAYDHKGIYIKVVFNDDNILQNQIVVGIDTYDDELGESVLPSGEQTTVRSEFAVTIDNQKAELLVTKAYDLFGIWHYASEDYQLYRSISTDGAGWNLVRWLNNVEHGSDDGMYQFPATIDEVGKLSVREMRKEGTSADTVFLGERDLLLFLPWTLINFTDPTANEVMHDNLETEIREVRKSDGIKVVLSLDGNIIKTERYPVTNIILPETIDIEKKSLGIISRYLHNN